MNVILTKKTSSSVVMTLIACVAVVCMPPSVKASTCPDLFRTLSRNMRGEDVRALQTYLGAPATGYFGVLTEAALKTWQARQGIVSSGSPGTTGWGVAGPRSRALMGRSCQNANTEPRPMGNTSKISLTLAEEIGQTKFSGSPMPGSAYPRRFYVSAVACPADASYTVNFGDGASGVTTRDPIVPGNGGLNACAWVDHTYTQNGVYEAKLYNNNRTNCASGDCVIGSETVKVVNFGHPTTNFSATPATGGAPLSVSFKAVPSTDNWNYVHDIDFGDGTRFEVMSWQCGSSMCKDHTYAAPGTYIAKLYRLNLAASGEGYMRNCTTLESCATVVSTTIVSVTGN